MIGELIQGLEGEAEIEVAALEDPPKLRSNYDAYDGYTPIGLEPVWTFASRSAGAVTMDAGCTRSTPSGTMNVVQMTIERAK